MLSKKKQANIDAKLHAAMEVAQAEPLNLLAVDRSSSGHVSPNEFQARLAALKDKKGRRDALTPMIGAPEPDVCPLPVKPKYPTHIICNHELNGEFKILNGGLYIAEDGRQKSKEIRCPHCTEEQERIRQDRFAMSLNYGNTCLPEYAREATFDTFPEDMDTPARDDVREYVRTAIEEMKQGKKPKGLFLQGKPRGGKTTLASCAAKHFVHAGYGVYFINMVDWLELMKRNFNKSAEEREDDHYQLIYNASVLIIDDLGSEATTGWNLDQIFNLIESRLSKGLLTIITSNNSRSALRKKWHMKIDPEVQQQSGRILDRFSRHFVEIEVQDYSAEG